MEPLRVLELYCGIGGMHYALKESDLRYEIVAAVDVNTVTNAIYEHNFPDAKLMPRIIESISLDEFNALAADMILMSPPCQPFTRVGNQRDENDLRTKSFYYLLDNLPKFTKKPKYILVENVKGFDESHTRTRLLETLDKCNYKYQEFLLTPLQFGIPNSRLRYFLLAKLQPLSFHFPTTSEFITEVPKCMEQYLHHKLQQESQTVHGSSHDDALEIFDGNSASSSGAAVYDKSPHMSCNLPTLVKTGECVSRTSQVTDNERTAHKSRDQSTQLPPGECVSRMSQATNNERTAHESCDQSKLVKSGEFVSRTSQVTKNERTAQESRDESTQLPSGDLVTSDVSYSDKSAHLLSDVTSAPSSDYASSHITGECRENKNTPHKKAKTSHSVTDESANNNDNHINQTVFSASQAESLMNVATTDESESVNFVKTSNPGHQYESTCRQLADFLEADEVGARSDYALPDKMLRRFWVMDIIEPCSKKSCCFTKRYGHYIDGAGSILKTGDVSLKDFNSLMKTKLCSDEDLDVIRKMGLRFFSPREISNLMCFPKEFCFPADISTKQRYRALGNSLNVHVVAVLLKMLIHGD